METSAEWIVANAQINGPAFACPEAIFQQQDMVFLGWIIEQNRHFPNRFNLAAYILLHTRSRFNQLLWTGYPRGMLLQIRSRVNILKRVFGPDARDEEYMSKTKTNKTSPDANATAISEARLDELIEEATVDCYNESEQISGLFNMLEERLAVPFTTNLLGMEIVVERIDITDEEEIVAICQRGRDRQRISILDLPLPRPKPAGAEWIEAYRRWARWR